jgi:hypothetical protein
VAATEQPVRLDGRARSVRPRPAPRAARLLAEAGPGVSAESQGRRVMLNIEDLSADLNPGVVYGVYLNLPRNWTERDRNHHHVGNVTVFGIEAMNDPDPTHDHVAGMRHTFDITRKLRVLERSGRVRSRDDLDVTFLLELPVPPPGYRGNPDFVLAEFYDNARSRPIRVGRVSVFVD